MMGWLGKGEGRGEVWDEGVAGWVECGMEVEGGWDGKWEGVGMGVGGISRWGWRCLNGGGFGVLGGMLGLRRSEVKGTGLG